MIEVFFMHGAIDDLFALPRSAFSVESASFAKKSAYFT
jgi:hypothetical protein